MQNFQDENGQSILHIEANRKHSKDGLYHMLQEKQLNIALRDALYRTGRDIAELSEIQENVNEIDRFVVYLAARCLLIFFLFCIYTSYSKSDNETLFLISFQVKLTNWWSYY